MREKVVHLQIQAYESSTVDRKEMSLMIHMAGFVGQLSTNISFSLMGFFFLGSEKKTMRRKCKSRSFLDSSF